MTLEKKQLQKLLQNLSIAKKWFLSEKFRTQETEMWLRKKEEFLFLCKKYDILNGKIYFVRTLQRLF